MDCLKEGWLHSMHDPREVGVRPFMAYSIYLFKRLRIIRTNDNSYILVQQPTLPSHHHIPLVGETTTDDQG